VNCSIDLTEEELFHVLLRRHGGVIKYPTISTGPESAGAIVVAPEGVAKADAGPSRLLEPVDGDHPNMTEERIEAVETVIAAALAEPPPLPPKPTRSRARTNGAEAPINSTPLAPSPPPEPALLDEPAMRSLLSKVGAVHPLKVKAITNILENCGGARRLSECDPATWPTIAEEAQKVLGEYGA
jgi:hypothetical protein